MRRRWMRRHPLLCCVVLCDRIGVVCGKRERKTQDMIGELVRGIPKQARPSRQKASHFTHARTDTFSIVHPTQIRAHSQPARCCLSG